MGNSQSTQLTLYNSSTTLQYYVDRLLQYYKNSSKSQRVLIWLTILVGLQRINKHNLIGLHLYLLLRVLSLPVLHLYEVIFLVRDDEQNMMNLTLRQQLFHDLLRYQFLYLPLNKQRKFVNNFAALSVKLRKPTIDRIYLHATNNPYSKDVYIDIFNGKQNINNNTKVILFNHGGAYVFGNTTQYTPAFLHMMKKLNNHKEYTNLTDVRVISVNYRLAPENKFPAQILDGLEAYDYCINTLNIQPHNIIIGGDSAGGNLSLSLAIQIRDTGRPMPCGILLISPWLDARYTEEPYFDWMFRDYLVRERVHEFNHSVFGNLNRSNIVCSPGLADVNHLPNVLVWYGLKEMLAAQIIPWKNQVQEQGIKNIQFISNRTLYHIAPLLCDTVGAPALDDLDQIVDWLGSTLNNSKASDSINNRPRVKHSKEMLELLNTEQLE